METTKDVRQAVVLLEPPSRRELEAERDALIRASVLPDVITTPDQYTEVAEIEAQAGRFLSRVEPVFKQHTQTVHRAWREACAISALFLDGPQKLKGRCRQLLGDFKDREVAERRAREREEAERDQQRRQQDQEAEANLLDAQGQHEMAEALRSDPVDAVPITQPSSLPDVGLTFREEWSWSPVGGDTPANRRRALSMLVRADFVQFVDFNDGALTAFAKRSKGTVKVPGIVFFSRQVPVRR
jgi:hypothetical protein